MTFPLHSFSALACRAMLTMNSIHSRRKCHHCGKCFSPDCRNRRHQYYCSKLDCRRSSKAASQRRWLRKAPNRDYFRGPEHTRRVQQWRKDHPGYWKKGLPAPHGSQITVSQTTKPEKTSCNVPGSSLCALQDFCLAKNPVFMGLLSMVAGDRLQEDIAATIGELLLRGQKILELVPPDQCDSKRCRDHDYETCPSTGSSRAHPQ
jgi:hypothetical protein